MPGFSSNITPGDPNAQWQVSYSSGNPSVLSVIGDVATIRQIGVATITATWTSASLGRTQNVLHPFSIIKGDPATRPNFSSPLTLPFGTDPITPSIFTRSDAPIQLGQPKPESCHRQQSTASPSSRWQPIRSGLM
jgi:hypothetical protein